MIASKTFNTKVIDTQFARDHVLPVTKDKTHVSFRLLLHEYTRLSWWALQVVVPLCAIALPIAF
jgi:hypothetical protein